MQWFWSYNWFTQKWKPENSYGSSVQWATHLKFYYVITDWKYVNNIFKEITVNVLVFKLQLIYSTAITSK